MQRTQIISSLKNQQMFKKAVLEMINAEIGAIDREIKYHEQLIESGDLEYTDTLIFEDKKPVENPFN